MKNIGKEITKLKIDFEDPFIIIAGDFNGKQTTAAIENFPDLREAGAGSTRGSASLDLIYTNFHPDIDLLQVRDPLQTESGRESDHSVIYLEANLTNEDRFGWRIVKSRPRTKKGTEKFGTLIGQAC